MKRAAIIGLGDIYPIHLAAIRNNAQLELVGLCDLDPACAAKVPEGVAFYTSYEQMIAETKPDCVHICLPHHLHVTVSKRAVELGCHVFCEKPPALNLGEALELARFEREHPERKIGICLQNRLNESVLKLREIISSGEYGAVVGSRAGVFWYRPQAYYALKPWRGTKAGSGSGCLINQAIHTLDLQQYLGGPVSRLKGQVLQLLDYGLEVEDTVAALLYYANGARGLFTATVANYNNESVQLNLQLEKAEFALRDNKLYRMAHEGEVSTAECLVEDERLAEGKFYYGASHAKLIAKFYQAIADDSSDYVKVRDALPSMALLNAVFESSETGAVVDVLKEDVYV